MYSRMGEDSSLPVKPKMCSFPSPRKISSSRHNCTSPTKFLFSPRRVNNSPHLVKNNFYVKTQ